MEQTILAASGLVTSPNELASEPGALVLAKNCMLLAPDLMGFRRGQPRLGFTFGSVGDSANTMAMFGTVPMVQYTELAELGPLATEDGDTLITEDGDAIVTQGVGTLVRLTSSAFVEVGDYDPPTVTQRMRFLEAAQNLYFTSSDGVYRLDQYNGTPILAGITTPKDILSVACNTTAGGFLGPMQSVGYRWTLCSKDAHGKIVESPPSGMAIVTNAQTLVAAYGTLTLASSSGTVGGTINGTSITTTWATSDTVTAAALAVLINANATLGALFVATALLGVVTITCRVAGSAGNSYTLTATGTNVSAATFAHGAAGDSFNVDGDLSLGDGPYTTQMFWRLYRTPECPGSGIGIPTPTEAIPPPDEEFLVLERYITTQDLAAGHVAFTDTTDDAFLTVPLYTNYFTAQGIGSANDTPPLCRDITWWDNRAWYWNIRQRQSLTLNIIGVGVGDDGGTGIREGDALTIGGWTFTAAASYSVMDLTFKLFTDSDDAFVNVANTTRSLVNLINQNQNVPSYETAPIMRAQYLGDGQTSFGTFVVEALLLTGEQFHVTLNTAIYTINAGDANRILDTVTATTNEDNSFANDDVVSVLSTNAADSGFDDLADEISITNPTTFVYADAGATAANSFPLTVRRVSPAPQFAWSPAPPPSFFNVAVGGLVRSGLTVTVTCDRDHGLRPGDYIPIEFVTTEDLNYPPGTRQVLTIPTSTTFTYAGSGSTTPSLTAYQSGSRVLSSPNATTNGAVYSKNSEFGVPGVYPEACPRTANLLPVGTAHTNTLRALALDQNQFVFNDDGIYIVSYGSGATPYTVDPLNSTAHIVAPDTAVVCNGLAFALTNKGVVTCTNAGVTVISGEIEQQLLQWYGPSFDALKTDAWACARETDGLYILGLPALEGASAPYDEPVMFVYSTRARKWTGPWTKPWRFGLVRKSDDALFFVAPTTDELAPTLAQERNTKTAFDYADDVTELVVTAWDSATHTLTVADASDVTVGDAIENLIVISIDGNDLVLSGSASFTPSVAATGGYTYVGGGGGGTFEAFIGGFTVSVSGGSQDAVVSGLAEQINLDPDVRALVTATANLPDGRVELVAVTPGVAGNEILTGPTSGPVIMHSDHITLEGGTDSSVDCYEAYPIDIQWRTLAAPSPADWRAFGALHTHWRVRSFRSATAAFTTDQHPAEKTIVMAPGQERDGTIADYTADPDLYPGQPRNPLKMRKMIPNLGPSAYLNVSVRFREAFAVGFLNGITIEAEPGSAKSQM